MIEIIKDENCRSKNFINMPLETISVIETSNLFVISEKFIGIINIPCLKWCLII